MIARNTVRLLFTLLLLALPSALAWGPLTHSLFSCQLYPPDQPLGPTGLTPNQTALFQGSDLPDAFFFGWSFISGPGAPCKQNATRLHDPVFAGWLVTQAVGNLTYANDPYYLSLALGFAAHTIADAVAFSPNGGFLGNGAGVIQWPTVWPFMLAVDAFLLQNGSFPSACPMPSSQPRAPLDQRGLDFISNVTEIIAVTWDPNFPVLSSDDLAVCTQPWGGVMGQMADVASTQLPAATVQQLVFFDRFGAKSAADVNEQLGYAFNCVHLAIPNFINQLLGPNASPEEAAESTLIFINNAFEQGWCTAP